MTKMSARKLTELTENREDEVVDEKLPLKNYLSTEKTYINEGPPLKFYACVSFE